MIKDRFGRVLIVCLSLLMLGGCAVKQALNDDPRDPWEGYNRQVFAFNEVVDMAVLKPVATGYQAMLPTFVRGSISNVFSNIGDLPNALNNLLQGDLGGGGNDLLRVLINTTLGMFGLFDPATGMHLTKQEEDFGQTLAVWGVGPGPYFIVPLIGPSTVRDFPGRVVDFLISPLNLISDDEVRTAMSVTEIIDTRAGFLDQEKILHNLSPDFYQQLKEFYLNRRKYLVRDGAVSVDDSLYEEIEEE